MAHSGAWWSPQVAVALQARMDAENRACSGRTQPCPGDPLYDAATAGNIGECRRLLRAGIPVDSGVGWFDETALSAAVRGGHLALVAMLLDKEACIEKANIDLWTPLSWAAHAGDTNMVALLLENGATVDQEDRFGNTPLWWAKKNRHTAIVALLIEHGAT